MFFVIFFDLRITDLNQAVGQGIKTFDHISKAGGCIVGAVSFFSLGGGDVKTFANQGAEFFEIDGTFHHFLHLFHRDL